MVRIGRCVWNGMAHSIIALSSLFTALRWSTYVPYICRSFLTNKLVSLWWISRNNGEISRTQHTPCPCWLFILERYKLCGRRSTTTQKYNIAMSLLSCIRQAQDMHSKTPDALIEREKNEYIGRLLRWCRPCRRLGQVLTEALTCSFLRYNIWQGAASTKPPSRLVSRDLIDEWE